MCWLRVLLPSGSSTDADDERSDISTAVSSGEMDLDLINENTNKKYKLLQEADKGTAGQVTFCARRSSSITSPLITSLTAQGPGLVAIKIASREMFCDKIATEIIALRRIHSLFAAEDNKTTVKHLPNLVGFDPIVDGGSRWLAVHPTRGFDLERVQVIITHMIQPLLPCDTGSARITHCEVVDRCKGCSIWLRRRKFVFQVQIGLERY